MFGALLFALGLCCHQSSPSIDLEQQPLRFFATYYQTSGFLLIIRSLVHFICRGLSVYFNGGGVWTRKHGSSFLDLHRGWGGEKKKKIGSGIDYEREKAGHVCHTCK